MKEKSKDMAIKQIRETAADHLNPPNKLFSGGLCAPFDFMPEDILIWKSSRSLKVTGTSIHQRMILKVILSGTCTMLADGIRMPMRAGDMICLFPYQFHTTRLECPREQYSFLAVTFVEKNRNYASFSALKNHILQPDREDAANLDLMIRSYRHQAGTHPEQCIFALLSILLNQRRKVQAVMEEKPEEPELFDRVCNYIRQHFTEKNISLKTLAAEFGVSAETVRREFLHADAGITPGRLIHRLRMQLAVELLDHSSESIAFISARCGYADPFTFSRAFKETMGCSPLHYRRNSRPPKLAK